MLRGSRHTDFTGPPLVQLLERLTAPGKAKRPAQRQAFADRLSGWLGWTDAIALSSALAATPASTPAASASASRTAQAPAPAASAEARDTRETRDADRVRAALLTAVSAPMDTTADFQLYRSHYLARQQAMDHAIQPLRQRLRQALATRSSAMAQLAAVDTVMERVLAPRERSLLATVPALLERHFVQLRDAAAAAAALTAAAADETAADADTADHGPAGPTWTATFHHDLQAVLLAELDMRLQPVDALLAALRGPQTEFP